MNFKGKKFLSTIIATLMLPSFFASASLYSSSEYSSSDESRSTSSSSISDSFERLQEERLSEICLKLTEILKDVYENGYKTERLIIERIKESDEETLAEQIYDEDVTRYFIQTSDGSRILENFKFASFEHAKAFTAYRRVTSNLKFIARTTKDPKEILLGEHAFVVRLKDSKEPIGVLGYNISTEDSKFLLDINYFIGKDYQQKGYAKEAAAALTNHIFQNISEGIFLADIYIRNKSSRRVAKHTIDAIIKEDEKSEYKKSKTYINNMVKYRLEKSLK